MNLPEKKAAVFRAVLKLLRQGRPLGDLKVSEIAEAAGIGKGTVYEYFPSREELLRDAMQYSRAQGSRNCTPPFPAPRALKPAGRSSRSPPASCWSAAPFSFHRCPPWGFRRPPCMISAAVRRSVPIPAA